MLPFLPLIAGAAGLVLFALAAALPPARRAIGALPTNALVAVHLLRGAGAAFVILGRKGILPPQIAERFGIGELAAAVLGAGILWLLTMPLDRKPRSVVAWSAFGLLNIAWFLLAWIREAPVAPEAPRIAEFPLALYLWIVIPIAVATHLELLRRAFSRKS